MVKRIVVAANTGDHFLGASHWDNSVELSLRKDGSVSVFGFALRADEHGELHRTRVFSRTGLRRGSEVAVAIDEAVEEADCVDVWDAGSRADALREVEAHCPQVAIGLREAWGDYLDDEATSD